MNICFTYPFTFHPFAGGIERVTHLLATELNKRGHSIFYLNYNHNTQYDNFIFPATVSYINENLDKTVRLSEYQQFLRDNDIHVVINQGGTMGSCLLFCQTGNPKIKCITTIHNTPWLNYRVLFKELIILRDQSLLEQFKRIYRIFAYPSRKRSLKKYLKGIYSNLSDNSDYVCLLSSRFIPELKKIVPISDKKLIAIGNPIDKVEPITSKKEKIVLFIARMELNQKRPDRMIKIWKEIAYSMPDWKLIMIGNGRGLEMIKKMARSVPNILFESNTNPDEFYRRGAILCMTSDYEGWGMVLTEAMSYGVVPMAFSSFASVHDLLLDDRQKVTPFSIKEYSRKLKYLMNNSSLRSELIYQGYKIVNRFSVDNVVNQWETIIKRVF